MKSFYYELFIFDVKSRKVVDYEKHYFDNLFDCSREAKIAFDSFYLDYPTRVVVYKSDYDTGKDIYIDRLTSVNDFIKGYC